MRTASIIISSSSSIVIIIIIITIALMIEAVRTSETSAYFNETTRRYNTEYQHLHTGRRENLKSHKLVFVCRL
jgi:hypothetical protein